MTADPRPLPSPTGELVVERRPQRANSPLQGWDGADRLLLEWLADDASVGEDDAASGGRARPVWVLNDRFGALTIGAAVLAGGAVVSLSDSITAREALRSNLAANAVPTERVVSVAPFASAIEAAMAASGTPTAVIGRFPHSHSLLDHQLALVVPHLTPGTPVALGVMAKQLRRPHVERLEPMLGPATVSLARHKARIVHFEAGPLEPVGDAPEAGYRTEPVDGLPAITTVGLPGVFSRDRLDPGARVLLRYLPALLGGTDDETASVVDLGCGNGVLSAAVGLLLPEVHVTMVDESHLATASARATIEANGLDPNRFVALAADRLHALAASSVDLVVCNPPFHQDQVIGDEVAWNMFHDARRVLRPTGRLVVVGNRHLGHHARLKRLFAQVDTVSADPKFVVHVARSTAAK